MSQAGFVFSTATHAGRVRRSNQDCCGASPAHRAFVVCDGMGGAAAGELASRLATDTFLAAIAAGQPAIEAPAPGNAPERLAAAIQHANHIVFRKAKHTRHLQGMGTTLVSVLLAEDAPGSLTAHIAHVGDSRCSLLREGTLRPLTVDHSLVEEQVQAGYISRAEAEQSPIRHVITRAVGSRPQVEPEIQSFPVHPGDLLLLATDGLSRELSPPDTLAILTQLPTAPSGHDLHIACTHLVDEANARGGRDNVTVLLLSIA